MSKIKCKGIGVRIRITRWNAVGINDILQNSSNLKFVEKHTIQSIQRNQATLGSKKKNIFLKIVLVQKL